ncbi:MAG: stage II sporulation protein M, partial [Actinomycetota bacterium]
RTGTDLGIPPAEQTALSSFIFTNNIRVTLLAFAAGITFGLGTAFILVSNGVLIGALGGLATAAGNGDVFVEYVVAHGVLELSCIVVGGAAGLRLGWAIVDPGYRTRAEALRTEGRATVELVLGTMPWLILAGLVEGFITPEGLGLAPMLIVGFLLGAIYWALVVWRGRLVGAVNDASEQRARLGTEIGSDARSG